MARSKKKPQKVTEPEVLRFLSPNDPEFRNIVPWYRGLSDRHVVPQAAVSR